MSITSRITGFVFLGLIVACGTAWSAAIQGEVKGPAGKLLKGAEVRIERKDKKGTPAVATTDKKGKYSFPKLDLGTYKLTATANGMTSTSSDITARADGAVRVDFDLKSGKATTKKTHRVWIAGNTGTNIGGRWVDVPDDEATAPSIVESDMPSADNLQRANSNSLRKSQQMGGGNSRGGN